MALEKEYLEQYGQCEIEYLPVQFKKTAENVFEKVSAVIFNM